jgi:hypothetical protein
VSEDLHPHVEETPEAASEDQVLWRADAPPEQLQNGVAIWSADDPAPDQPEPPAPSGGGGRHARRDGQPPPPLVLDGPQLDYVPRHAASADSPGGIVSPTDLTQVFAKIREDPTERPRLHRPESAPVPPPGHPDPLTTRPPAPDEAKAEPTPSGKRVRVVLSQRKGQVRPVRTVVDVQELTHVGEVLSASLIRSQLALALRIGAVALLGLGVLPIAFYLVPDLGRFELFGLRLPWILLGGLAYPFMVALGYLYVRSAEKLEQIFADHIQS